MLDKIRTALNLLDSHNRHAVIAYAVARALLGVLDLFGILLMGLLLAQTTSVLTSQNSESEINSPIDLPILNELTISQLALAALAAFIAKSILSTIFMKLMVNSLARAEFKIATKLFGNSLSDKNQLLLQRSKSDSVFSLTYSAGYGITDLLTVSVTIFSEAFLLLAITMAFAIVDLKITIIIAIYFLGIALLIQTVVGKQFQKAGTQYANSAVASSLLIENTVDAYREIVTLKKQNYFINKFNSPREKMAGSTATVQFLYALPRYIVESALMIGAVGLAAISVQSGEPVEAAQTLGIFLTGGLRIMASMLPLQNALGASRQLAARAEKFFDFAEALEEEILFDDSSSGMTKETELKSTSVGVKLSGVSFTYPNSTVAALSDINLVIEPGQLVAFIGPSGAGKSTLADLIIGINECSLGNIEYFSDETLSIHESSFQFGYVPQSPGLVAGSIRENIALGVPIEDINKVALEKSITQSHLTDVIESLEFGIDTDLGSQSNSLSGGQLQRIGLARSLYVKPNLLVLDEATSSLDAESEAAVSSSLNELRGVCTIVVIAHRLTTVQNADMVFVVEQGRITAQGTFSDLVKTNDLVARYVELSEVAKN
jgi:ATP-binding cassette subfamily C protein